MSHAHHWLLEEPSGAQVTGRCKHCGEERLFASGRDWGSQGDRWNRNLDMPRDMNDFGATGRVQTW